jgi:hypothetical protein
MDDSADTAMPHPSGEAFAFDERGQRGEVTGIVCARARLACLAEGLHRDGHFGEGGKPLGERGRCRPVSPPGSSGQS